MMMRPIQLMLERPLLLCEILGALTAVGMLCV